MYVVAVNIARISLPVSICPSFSLSLYLSLSPYLSLSLPLGHRIRPGRRLISWPNVFSPHIRTFCPQFLWRWGVVGEGWGGGALRHIKNFSSHLKRVKWARFKINYIVIFPWGALLLLLLFPCCCSCCLPCWVLYDAPFGAAFVLTPPSQSLTYTHTHWGRQSLVSESDTPIPYVTHGSRRA